MNGQTAIEKADDIRPAVIKQGALRPSLSLIDDESVGSWCS
jgi:hypothetical protein